MLDSLYLLKWPMPFCFIGTTNDTNFAPPKCASTGLLFLKAVKQLFNSYNSLNLWLR
jgi:hypothetical protein